MTTLDYQKQAASWSGGPGPAPPSESPRVDPEVCIPSTQPVRAYLDCRFTQRLEERYGERWQGMQKYSKLTFRAALSLYVFWSQWLAAASPEALMAEALEQINSDLRLEDAEVYEAIAACIEFSLQDLERLLQALGEQIADGCWSPNS